MKKPLAAILVAVIAISAFSIVASASARPFMNWKTFQQMPNSTNRPIQQSFMRVNAVVKEWSSVPSSFDTTLNSISTNDVKGVLQAQSRTIKFNGGDSQQGASVTATWKIAEQANPSSGASPTPSPSPTNSPTEKTVTSTFYTAKLVKTDSTELNPVDTADFVLKGTWNVYAVTVTYSKTTDSAGNILESSHSQKVAAKVLQSPGTFTISDEWTTFTLDITGTGGLSGTVSRQRISSTQFNVFKVNDDGTNVVTKSDVSSVAKAFGSGLGWGNYDQRMDYNFNYKIDIADLATAAANINS